MKKIAIALAFCLLLAGCQPDAPVSASGSEPEGSASAVEQDNSSESTESAESSQPDESGPGPSDAPMPDAPPPTTVGAIDLPESLYSSSDGYSLELLTPAQYDAFLDLSRGGPRGYLAVDYFLLGQGDLYAVANANGKIVTDFLFDWNATYWEGTAVPIARDGLYGVVSALDGSVLVPFEYDYTWPVARSNGQLFEARKGDTTFILDLDGQTRYTLERGGDAFYVVGDSELLLQDGMLRFYDHKSGQPLANFACKEVKLASLEENGGENVIAFRSGSLWGLCDESGEIILDPTYEEIGYFKGDYAAFSKDGKKGILNYRGEVCVKAEWDDIQLYDHSVSVCRDNKWGAITNIDSGELAIEPMYDFVMGFGENGTACFERDGKYGVIDREGNELVAGRFDNLIDTSANLDKGYYLIEGDDGPWSSGIIDGKGREIVPDNYSVICASLGDPDGSEEPDIYNLIMAPNGKWGFIDREGQIVIDTQYDQADAFLAGRDVAFVNGDGTVKLIDRKGRVVLDTVFSDLIAYNPETMVCAMEYTNQNGERKSCLCRLNMPA